jgi:sugar phosphate isomerase/epimerase
MSRHAMNKLTRRQFVSSTAGLACAAAAAQFTSVTSALAADRMMTICLSPGAIGVSANQVEAISLAQRFGFESVEPSGESLAKLSDAERTELAADLSAKKLVFGAAGLPLEFRHDETKFNEGLKRLPTIAAALQGAGVSRCGTWLSPSENSRTYLKNFKVHAARLRQVAAILKDHGQRLGLEYVGTKTLRERCRYPFIHSMAEMRELIAEIGTGNVGIVLDSWHWWQAEDSVADILALQNADVVSVDLNDAPVGIAKEKQLDGKRELPAATGVIDLTAFLNALHQIGYDGPVRAEPFNRALNELNNEEACAATIAAMKKAFALMG